MAKEETIVDVRENLSRAERFVEKNRNVLFGVLAVAILGVAGWTAYNNFVVGPKSDEAASQMWVAEAALLNDSLDIAINGDGINLGLEDIATEYSGTVHADRAHYLLGIAYRDQGNFEDALAHFEQANISEPNLAAVNEGSIGDMKVELGDVSGAISHFEKAANGTINPEIKSIYLMKAAMAAKSNGDSDRASRLLAEIVDDLEGVSNHRDAIKQLAAMPSN